MIALSVKNITKSYGCNEVLKNISLEINTGEIFAVLGVNGAGKTTLLECIEGLRRYDGGSIEILGSVHADALKKGLLGVQLQSSTLPEQIKVSEAVRLFSAWNKFGNEKSLIDRFNLGEIAKKKYCELSTGQKRRLHLALALVGNPEIIFLDEPTAGLDIEARAGLHKEIRAMKAAGKTIIIASHDMAEVEALSDRLAVLNGGKIVFCGSVNEFTAINKGKFKVHIKTAGTADYTVYEIENLSKGLLKLLQAQNEIANPIADIKIERPTLEESFLMISREDKTWAQ